MLKFFHPEKVIEIYNVITREVYVAKIRGHSWGSNRLKAEHRKVKVVNQQ